jgi:hypothetical protein
MDPYYRRMMKPRYAGLILGATVLAASLAGCTNLLPPEPSGTPLATEAAQCSPTTVAISWDAAIDDGIDLVSQNQTTYGADGVSTGGGSSLREDATVQPFTLLESLGGDPDEWESMLVDHARASGEVPDAFGDVSTLTTSESVDIAERREGTYVSAVVGNYLELPFRLTCENGVVTSGTITAVDSTSFSPISLFCGDVFDAEKPENAGVTAAHSACDTAAG